MKAHSIHDLRRLARRRLPGLVFDFLEGGALDELTLDRNRTALDQLLLPQRVLRDVSVSDTRTDILGQSLDLPLVVSPMGMLTGFHPAADVAVARAAARAGSRFIHSPWSGCSLEEVAQAAPGHVWAQIAFFADEGLTRSHIQRAKALGIDTLVIAGDVAVSSKRDRDLAHGTSMPPKPPLKDVINTALHPGWILRWLTGRPMTYGTYTVNNRPIKMNQMGPFMQEQERKNATWDSVAQLREQWDGKIIVKGVMAAEDARLAVNHGADGVFVSNHGGRQFDAQLSTIEALPRVVDAVDGRGVVIMDGGIRRGSDVYKALALGADLVSAGRPFAYGLAAAAESGVDKAFEILKDELETVLGFVGAPGLRGELPLDTAPAGPLGSAQGAFTSGSRSPDSTSSDAPGAPGAPTASVEMAR